MDQKFFETLLTPEGLNDYFNADFHYRRSRDPKSVEAFIQRRHRDMMQAAMDIARAQTVLAKTQVDRFREREKEALRKKEKSYLHADFVIRPNGYTWVASWRTGGYVCSKEGTYIPVRYRIPTNGHGDYNMKEFNIGAEWAKSLAKDCEQELRKLRQLNKSLMRVREGIYRLSKEWRQYFDDVSGCSGYLYRAPALTQAEAEKDFMNRFGLQKHED